MMVMDAAIAIYPTVARFPILSPTAVIVQPVVVPLKTPKESKV